MVGNSNTKLDLNTLFASTGSSSTTTIDSDRDGQLSATEHAAGSNAIFAKMDVDVAGFLTADEIQRGLDEMLKKPT